MAFVSWLSSFIFSPPYRVILLVKMQSFSLAVSLLLSLAARHGEASCAYGTSLHKRQEGQVPINTFGYAGAIVRLVRGGVSWG